MKKHNFPEFTFKNADKIEYRVVWKAPARSMKADGLCDDPICKNPEVWINPKLEEKRILEIIAEEFFHAHCFEKAEKVARKFAANLSKLLYKSGWRLRRN